jgi:FixJ family two-component response regulator
MLLDMRMPDVSGWDVIRELKTLGNRTPIVIVSASPDAARVVRETEIAGYIEKPFALTDVLETVERVCRNPRSHLSRMARAPSLLA